jgi:hypothetical protein
LRWLAKQAETLSAPGRPKVVSFWAYEEPENNLEMSSCLELAKERLADSDQIQTFVTTHAPAYYSIAVDAPKEKVLVFGVTKDASSGETEVKRIIKEHLSYVDESMGLMPLIQPYLRNALDKINELKKVQERLSTYDKPTLFVEGPSDKSLIVQSLRLFHPKANEQIRIECSQPIFNNSVLR